MQYINNKGSYGGREEEYGNTLDFQLCCEPQTVLKKNEVLLYATTWINFVNIILSIKS